MAFITGLGEIAGLRFRAFMRDAGFSDDDPRLKKLFFGGFLLGASEALAHGNGTEEEFRRELRKFQITVQQMLLDKD